MTATASRSVAKNTFLLTLGLMSGRILALFIQKKMTPLLGPSGMGIFALATDLTTILLVVTNFGLGTLMTREVTKDHASSGAILLGALQVRLALGVVCYLGMIIYLQVTGEAHLTRVAVLVTGLTLFVESAAMACDAVLQGFDKVGHQTTSQIVSAITYFALGIWWLNLGWGVMGVIWANFASRVARLLVIAPLMLRSCGPWRTTAPEGHTSSALWMMKLGLPMFMATTLGIISYKIDTVMLNLMVGKAATGIYYLGHRALDMLLIAPNIFATAFFPALARYATKSDVDTVRMGERALRIMVIFALPTSLFFTLVAGPIIDWFARGTNDANPITFAASVHVMRIVVWGLPFVAVSQVFNRLLITAGHERVFTRIGLVAVLVNVGLNTLLIPRYSYLGAGVATVISLAASTVMYVVFLRRTVHRPPLRRSLLGGVASLAVGWFAGVALLRILRPDWSAGWWALPTDRGWTAFLVACGLVAVCYLAAVFGLRVLGREDLQLLRPLLRRQG